MKTMLRPLPLLCAVIGLSVGLGLAPAEAKTHKHHVTHHHTTRKHHAAASSGSRMVKTAQTHLIHLGYLDGHADGVLGPKTKNAIKRFQHDHGLRADGKLTTPTYNALIEADMSVASINNPMGAPLASGEVPDFYAGHPDFYGHYDQQYADPMMLSQTVIGDGSSMNVRSQSLPSRFGKVDVSENNQGAQRTYTVTMNGQPLIQADGQPSVVGVSRTYQLNDEDAIIFSTFRANDPVCAYKHYLLTLNSNGQNLQEIGNCTRGYQAQVTDNSLVVVFPETDDKRAVGNTWRYEKGDLERL